MVRRKRTRKYESSEDNDSDSDYAVDIEPAEPAPKKYSLRTRKSTTLTADFAYDVGGAESASDSCQPSEEDDEDFAVDEEDEEDESEAESAVSEHIIVPEHVVDAVLDDDASGPQDPDGLIDFEDIIRADVVVNKNRIDYDNVIHKTEIKVQERNRRGRRPKNQVDGGVTVVEDVDCVTVLCPPDALRSIGGGEGLMNGVETATETKDAAVDGGTPKEPKGDNGLVQNADNNSVIIGANAIVAATDEKLVEAAVDDDTSCKDAPAINKSNGCLDNIKVQNVQTVIEENYNSLTPNDYNKVVKIESKPFEDDDDIIILEEQKIIIVLDD